MRRYYQRWYKELENKFCDIRCDVCITMPNHIHCIIRNVGADLRVCPNNKTEERINLGEHIGSPLHRVVQWFKTTTTNDYIRGIKQNHWTPFHGCLWQRNYYEHIIRNDESLNRIREYILTNPKQWELDRENPANVWAPHRSPLQNDEPWTV